mmetsp:Transcript_5090/g.12159  ORF Transcript_5090/g.12159 Transcript_5090/m.12159 type:complete len:606 (-) Transcript_5090:97-1914(-)
MNHHNHDTTSVILAIDVGSSSVRCTAYHYSEKNDAIGTIPADGCSSSIQRPGVEPITGSIQTNGLFEAVDSAVDEVLSKLRSSEGIQKQFKVEAVGFSTFVMNLIAVDDCGNLIPFEQNAENDENSDNSHQNTPTIGISYACNAPDVHAECQNLRQELGPDGLDKLYQATGAPLHSAYALPQLRALYNKSKLPIGHRWQSITGYCLSRWTNRKHAPLTYSEASWTGLLNVRDCVFEESAIRCLPQSCRDALPELTDFTDCIHGIPEFLDDGKTNPYWTKFHELRNARFFLGIGDGACANVGSKCTTDSRIAVTVGTSAAVRMCMRHEASSSELPFRIPDCRGLFCYRIDRNHVLVGGALTDGGSIVEWALQFLNLEKDEQAFQTCLEETRKLVEAECREEETNRHREIIMAPFLSGERSTGFRDGAAGAVFGLTRETTSAHFFKSCLEGVSLRLKAIIDLLLVVVDQKKLEDRENAGGKNDDGTDNDYNSPPVMVASGKAMEANHLWRQMIADSSGLRVVLDKDSAEGTSRGVARLVAMSLLAEKDSSIMSEESKRISLTYATHEEDLHPFLTSEARSTASSMYERKSRLQEGFIDSIAPFFSST